MYLGIYAFNNPEPQAYYIEGTNVSQPELVPTVPDPNALAEGVTPIHDQFVLWFKWNFANSLVSFFVTPCVVFLIMRIMFSSPTCGKLMGCVYNCGICASSLTIYILGLMWRYSAAGKFASGDELAEDAVAGDLY